MLAGDNFWHVADDRWQLMDDDAADREEQQVRLFAEHRNLAAGWHGLSVPALYWYRLGQDVRLCPEGMKPIDLPFAEAVAGLVDIGNTLAAQLPNADADGVRTPFPLMHWRNREQVSLDTQVAIATGLDQADVTRSLKGQTIGSFWRLSEPANESELTTNSLLAAARMASTRLDRSRVTAILERLRQLPPARALPSLEALSVRLKCSNWSGQDTPYTQGYSVAGELRRALGLMQSATFDPAFWLSKWGVRVQSTPFGTPDLEAIAVWGNLGPAILVNDAPHIRPAHRFGYRFVLAHEMCHLLIDRERALPAAEILGGQVLPALEQRANAFAAEILLPREEAARTYRQATTLEAAVRTLVEGFDVSRQVAKAQIKNSGAASGADLAEMTRALESDVPRFAGPTSRSSASL
jgi:Zn-dependent peptidase ImmA (M78 family)